MISYDGARTQQIHAAFQNDGSDYVARGPLESKDPFFFSFYMISNEQKCSNPFNVAQEINDTFFVFQKLKTVATLGKRSFVSSTANVSVSDVCSANKSKQHSNKGFK